MMGTGDPRECENVHSRTYVGYVESVFQGEETLGAGCGMDHLQTGDGSGDSEETTMRKTRSSPDSAGSAGLDRLCGVSMLKRRSHADCGARCIPRTEHFCRKRSAPRVTATIASRVDISGCVVKNQILTFLPKPDIDFSVRNRYGLFLPLTEPDMTSLC